MHLKTPPNLTSSPKTIALWLFKNLRSICLKRNIDCRVYGSKEVHMITLDSGWNVAGIDVFLVIGMCCWKFENVLKDFGVHFCLFDDPLIINYLEIFSLFFAHIEWLLLKYLERMSLNLKINKKFSNKNHSFNSLPLVVILPFPFHVDINLIQFVILPSLRHYLDQLFVVCIRNYHSFEALTSCLVGKIVEIVAKLLVVVGLLACPLALQILV